MNAHVFVLVLLSAGLMAVWDGDQNYNNQVLVSRARARAAVVAPVAKSSGQAFKNNAPNTSTIQTRKTASTHQSVARTIPVPLNLQSGTWRAISDRGDSLLITIETTRDVATTADGAVNPLGTETNNATCITSQKNGLNWCFFKQQSSGPHSANRLAVDGKSKISR